MNPERTNIFGGFCALQFKLIKRGVFLLEHEVSDATSAISTIYGSKYSNQTFELFSFACLRLYTC